MDNTLYWSQFSTNKLIAIVNQNSFYVRYVYYIWFCFYYTVVCLAFFVSQIDLLQQPRIILSHETFNSIGSWAITPILASSIEYIDNIILSSRNLNAATAAAAAQKVNALPLNVTVTPSPPPPSASPGASQTKWLILCEDQSIVDLKALINNLQNEDYTKVSCNSHTSVGWVGFFVFFFSSSFSRFILELFLLCKYRKFPHKIETDDKCSYVIYWIVWMLGATTDCSVW